MSDSDGDEVVYSGSPARPGGRRDGGGRKTPPRTDRAWKQQHKDPAPRGPEKKQPKAEEGVLVFNDGHLPGEAAAAAAAESATFHTPPAAVATYEVQADDPWAAGVRKRTHVVAELQLYKAWTNGLAFARNRHCLPHDVCLHGVDKRSFGAKSEFVALPGDIVVVELDPVSEWKPVDTERGGGKHEPLGLNRKDGSAATVVAAAGAHSEGVPAEQVTICRAVTHDKRSTGMHSPATRITAAMCGGEPPAKESYAAAGWPAGSQPQGKIVAVLERRFTRFQVCKIVSQRDKETGETKKWQIQGSRFYSFKSYDDGFPHIAVYGRDIPAHLHDTIEDTLLLLEVQVAKDGRSVKFADGKKPFGVVAKSLGRAGTVETESAVIATVHKVKDQPFTEEVEACVAESCPIPDAAELKRTGRRDLRDTEFVCTIDPATARDLDDALSISKIPGGYRVGVHIADVSHFVDKDCPLDEEARDRATSVYFVDRVIPMLPRRLCEDYCSLNAGVDKHAFSVIWTINNKAEIQSEWFGQSVIRNRCRMAYEDAQRIIDGDESGDSLKFVNETMPEAELKAKVVESVKMLQGLAVQLRDKRYAVGAISLNRAKMRFRFEDMNSKLAPLSITTDRSKEANWLIEEFMLLANRRVATKITQFFPESTLLRKHDPPDRKKLKVFQEAAKSFGFDISTKSSGALNQSMLKYKDHKDSDALRFMATLCMQLAKYCCSDADGKEPVSHYALAMPLYNHFTSPIRRYADLITHRQLLLALDVEVAVKGKGESFKLTDADVRKLPHGRYLYHPEEISEICDNCNKRKEAARKAGDASVELFLCMFLDAIEAASQLRPEIPPTLVLRVVVVRIQKQQFMIANNALGLSKQLFHQPHSQSWKGENEVEEDLSSFVINWGTPPKGGDEVREKVMLFSVFLVTLKPTRQGHLMIDMLIHPPWHRDASLETNMNFSLGEVRSGVEAPESDADADA